ELEARRGGLSTRGFGKSRDYPNSGILANKNKPPVHCISAALVQRGTGLREATAFNFGGRSGTDGRGDDPPGGREQRRNCHSKSQHVDVCECGFVCQRTMGGRVMALRSSLPVPSSTPPPHTR
ncbi:Pituitary homeobox 1, partial [Dissostichus eleginoides]